MEGFASQGSDEVRGVAGECGLVALAAVGHGGEVWCVGFQHEGFCGAAGDGVADAGGVLEGGDSSEGNEASEIEDAARVVPIDGEGVLKRGVAGFVAGVDDDVEFRGCGEFEVLARKWRWRSRKAASSQPSGAGW